MDISVRRRVRGLPTHPSSYGTIPSSLHPARLQRLGRSLSTFPLLRPPPPPAAAGIRRPSTGGEEAVASPGIGGPAGVTPSYPAATIEGEGGRGGGGGEEVRVHLSSWIFSFKKTFYRTIKRQLEVRPTTITINDNSSATASARARDGREEKTIKIPLNIETCELRSTQNATIPTTKDSSKML